jgi:hypothetical protein
MILKVDLCATCAATLKTKLAEDGEAAMRAIMLSTLQACAECSEKLPKPAPGGRLVMSEDVAHDAFARAAALYEQLRDDARELIRVHAAADPHIIEQCKALDAVIEPLNPSPLNVGFCLGLKARDVLHLHSLVLMVVAGYLCNHETGVRGPWFTTVEAGG